MLTTIPEPTRIQLDAEVGCAMIEFGTDWCSHCLGAQPLIALAIGKHPKTRHIKVTDGQGKSLGRSYRVKLWPTLVFIKHGLEVSRLVRPQSVEEIERELLELETAD